MKTILDSVHGHIKIPKTWCERILDTDAFQRLRRIEQNSCRSVFPSARHDRFIHSLGVYHIGSQITTHLEKTCKCLPKGYEDIFKTYHLACLLHDVGHTPFSHTFEEYYNREDLISEIRKELNDDIFNSDSKIPIEKLTHHELLSALVGLIYYKDILSEESKKEDLFVRMIIGLPYTDEDGKPDKTKFENIMIELIHGTIDADGLDYVCRDVWAGGYHNFSVDLQRLIESITIDYKESKYTLAFSSKSLNEIETVLNVKNFQFLYVINHHKVILEQHYLVEGVKSAARYHLKIANRDEALAKLCDFTSFLRPIEVGAYKLYQPCDDDFVTLMKQTVTKDKYIEQWFSRSHSMRPLWKSKPFFFHLFDDIITLAADSYPEKEESESVKTKRAKEMVAGLADNKICKEFVIDTLKISEDDIFIHEVKPKLRQFDPNKIKVFHNDEPIEYNRFYNEGFTVYGHEANFYFWYIEKRTLEGITAEKIIESIKDYMKQKLRNEL